MARRIVRALNVDLTKLRPSELIRLAVEDVRAVQKLEGYELEMGEWHQPAWSEDENPPSMCLVCVAGSVVVQHDPEENPEDVIEPYDFGPNVGDRLAAIDYFRQGRLRAGLHQCGIHSPVPGLDRIDKQPKLARLLENGHDRTPEGNELMLEDLLLLATAFEEEGL